MAAIINTNVISLNAQRNLNSSQNALATTLQRLSSGLRINLAPSVSTTAPNFRTRSFASPIFRIAIRLA